VARASHLPSFSSPGRRVHARDNHLPLPLSRHFSADFPARPSSSSHAGLAAVPSVQSSQTTIFNDHHPHQQRPPQPSSSSAAQSLAEMDFCGSPPAAVIRPTVEVKQENALFFPSPRAPFYEHVGNFFFSSRRAFSSHSILMEREISHIYHILSAPLQSPLAIASLFPPFSRMFA